ncbi:MAG: hypothetical protein JWQ81_960 [Amycolatopsis sp.]|nr:hypothetical protein [Amycolatopsis sp.]
MNHQQLVALTLRREVHLGKYSRFPAPRDSELASYLDDHVTEHARNHGWDTRVATRTRAGLHILLGLQDTPGAAINASEVTALSTLDVPVRRILEVLAITGFLNDDRVPTIERWFTAKTATLPADMVTGLRIWFDVMKDGSTVPPRSRPRAGKTIRLKLRWALPALLAWADSGHEHLREITREDVLAVLPASGTPRHTMLQGLRSIMGALKAHKVVFINPTTRIRADKPSDRVPLPQPVEQIRAALFSPDPAQAVIAALVGFYALQPHQLRALQLTDIHDGRLHLPGRSIPMATPVRERLHDYLEHRSQRWPHTANQHLFIHYNSANHLGPVRIEWLTQRLGMSAQALREDRILYELNETGGDIRRLCDLFGLSVEGALRYSAALDPPGTYDDLD